MKFLFCGLGSIGTRHLRDTAKILSDQNIKAEYYALRSSKRELANDVQQLLSGSYYDISEIDRTFDVIFINNPTSLHFETLLNLKDKGRMFFIEKPLFEKVYDISVFLSLENKLYYVACPMRFNPSVCHAKEFLKDKKILSVRSICSSYLPSWRPGTDYRECYSAIKEQGGGVRLDLIHEWDYLCYLLGFPTEVKSFESNASALEISSEDSAVYIAKYPQGFLLTLALDYFGKVPKRELEVITDDGTVVFDMLGLKTTIYENDKVETIKHSLKAEYRFLETEYFLELCLGRKTENKNSLENAVTTLGIAIG